MSGAKHHMPKSSTQAPRAGVVHGRARQTLFGASVAALGLALSFVVGLGAASANQFGGNSGWSAPTNADLSSQGGVQSMIQQKAGGGYNYNYTTTNTTTTTIMGNQTNCSLSSSATGNSGTTSGYASTSSPSVSSTPATSAASTHLSHHSLNAAHQFTNVK